MSCYHERVFRIDIIRSLLVILVLFYTSGPAFASLHVLLPVTLEPGDLLEQTINWDRPSGVRMQIRLESAPDDAKLTLTDKGVLVLRWQTGPDMADETLLPILVLDVDTQELIDIQVLKVLKKPASRPTVALAPLAGQIVSAGRVVSIRFNATSSDSKSPTISMDRLPRNATLSRNSSGVFVFFWQTSDRDQGEHVFRVTATHPANSSVSTMREVTIVVGDPSLTKTVPKIQASSLDDQ